MRRIAFFSLLLGLAALAYAEDKLNIPKLTGSSADCITTKCFEKNPVLGQPACGACTQSQCAKQVHNSGPYRAHTLCESGPANVQAHSLDINVYPLQFAAAKEAATEINEHIQHHKIDCPSLSKVAGKERHFKKCGAIKPAVSGVVVHSDLIIAADEKANSLIVVSSPEYTRHIAQLVGQIDQPRETHRIRLLVVQIEDGKERVIARPAIVTRGGRPTIIENIENGNGYRIELTAETLHPEPEAIVNAFADEVDSQNCQAGCGVVRETAACTRGASGQKCRKCNKKAASGDASKTAAACSCGGNCRCRAECQCAACPAGNAEEVQGVDLDDNQPGRLIKNFIGLSAAAKTSCDAPGNACGSAAIQAGYESEGGCTCRSGCSCGTGCSCGSENDCNSSGGCGSKCSAEKSSCSEKCSSSQECSCIETCECTEKCACSTKCECIEECSCTDSEKCDCSENCDCSEKCECSAKSQCSTSTSCSCGSDCACPSASKTAHGCGACTSKCEESLSGLEKVIRAYSGVKECSASSCGKREATGCATECAESICESSQCTDETLVKHVAKALCEQLGRCDIKVTCRDGHVELDGTAPEGSEAIDVPGIVARVPGVKSIEDRLRRGVDFDFSAVAEERCDTANECKDLIAQKFAFLVDKFNDQYARQQFAQAEAIAQEAKALDPENPVGELMYWKARFSKRLAENQALDGQAIEHTQALVPCDRQPADSNNAVQPAECLDGSGGLHLQDAQDGPDIIQPLGFEELEESGVVPAAFAPELSIERIGTATSRSIDPEIRIQAALERPISLRFDETPIKEACKEIGRAAGINVWLDERGLEDQGHAPATPVTLEVQEVKLKSALALLLEPLHLDYEIAHEVLKITSKDRTAQREMSVASYEVGDLSFSGSHCNDGALADLDAIAEVIRGCVAPDRWDVAGGRGSIRTFQTTQSLVIRQDAETHGQIAALLDGIRKIVQRSTPDEPPALLGPEVEEAAAIEAK